MSETEKEMEAEVIRAVDKIRPYVQHDGGDLEFVCLENGIAHVRFWGACAGCFLAEDDFDNGIRNFILDEVKDLQGVVLDPPNLEANLDYWL